MEEPNLKACIPKTFGYVAEHQLALLTQDIDAAIFLPYGSTVVFKRESE